MCGIALRSDSALCRGTNSFRSRNDNSTQSIHMSRVRERTRCLKVRRLRIVIEIYICTRHVWCGSWFYPTRCTYSSVFTRNMACPEALPSLTHPPPCHMCGLGRPHLLGIIISMRHSLYVWVKCLWIRFELIYVYHI